MFIFPAPYVAAGVASITYEDTDSSSTDLTTYTFSSKSLGTAVSGRRIIVTVSGRQSTVPSISSLTVAGSTATQVVQQTSSSGNARTAIYIVTLSTGTTGDVVVTWASGVQRCGIGVYSVTGLTSNTAHDTLTSTADPATGTIDVPDNGFIVGIGYSNGVPNTWAGITEDFDTDIEAGSGHGGASDNFATGELGRTITFNPTGTIDITMSVASWGP